MWLPYLPAVALGADPRLINLLCVIFAVIIIILTSQEGRVSAILLLPVFLLTPYLAYRHEIYLGVVILVLSVVFALFQRKQWLACGAFFGYAIATYQFSWVIFPFFVISIFKKSGIIKALSSMVVGIGVSLMIILPFFLSSPDMFLEGVYGHWNYFYVSNINIAYFLSFLLPWNFLIVIQGIILLIVLTIAIKTMDPDDMWGWMAGALLLFIALNRNIESYFYLLVLFLLLLHGIAVSGYQPVSKEKVDSLGESGQYEGNFLMICQ
ncbi:MAG: hypothetical protein LUQ37_11335 [Methanoregulaceae archaeon]|nr:hypothetical protein [Methanoregulaceae archaeon]